MVNTESKMISLYVAEEVEIYREVYKSILSLESSIELLGISNNQDLPSVRDAVSALCPDVLLFGTKRLNGVIIAELQQFREEFPKIGIVLLLMRYDKNIHLLRELVKRGKTGVAVFLKQSLERVDQLCRIIASVNEGHVILDPALTSLFFAEKQGHPFLRELTPRELELLSLLASGYTNSAIAETLCIDIRTVQRHINNMYSKIRANSDFGFDQRHLRVSATRLYLETTGELLASGAPG